MMLDMRVIASVAITRTLEESASDPRFGRSVSDNSPDLALCSALG